MHSPDGDTETKTVVENTANYLGILLSFKLVQQLGTEHNVEIFFNALGNLSYCIPTQHHSETLFPLVLK